jgi:hypothetical protein
VLTVAIFVAATTPGVAVGIELGLTVAVPPFLFAHVGLDARVHFASIVIRGDATVEVTIYPIGLQTADLCAQWAFDVTDSLDVAVGGGVTGGFVMTQVTDSTSPTRFFPAAGGLALGTVEYRAGEHMLLSADLRLMGEALDVPHVDGGLLTASIVGGIAYQF